MAARSRPEYGQNAYGENGAWRLCRCAPKGLSLGHSSSHRPDRIPDFPMSDFSPISTPNFAALFTQLQARYPSSSLVTEVVHVQEGFTVRALVQIGNLPLASGLATAATVEQAEDQARLRVLTLLGLLPTPAFADAQWPVPPGVAQSDFAPQLPSRYGHPAQLLAESLDLGGLVTRSPLAAAPPTTFEFEEASALPPPAPPASETSALPPPLKPVYAFGSSVSAQAAPSIAAEVATPAQPELAVVPAVAAANPPAKSRPSKAKADMPQVAPDLPQTDASASSGADAGEASGPAPVVDLTPLFLQIEDEMERIGWTKEQGRIHLKTAYGKRSRQQLTDEELADFLQHLQSCPTG